MKKTLALALAVVMSLGLLAGCGNSGEKNPGSSGSGSTPNTSASNPGGSSNPANSIPEAPAGGGTVGVCIYKFDDAFMTT